MLVIMGSSHNPFSIRIFHTSSTHLLTLQQIYLFFPKNTNTILWSQMTPFIRTIGAASLPNRFAFIMFSQWMEAAKESASKLLSNGKEILTTVGSLWLFHV